LLKRSLLIGACLLALGAFWASPAGAQEEGGEGEAEIGELRAECIESLEHGESIDHCLELGYENTSEYEDEGLGHFEDKFAAECAVLLAEGEPETTCEEAPNPILPATEELIAGALSFVILFGLLAKFAFPAIKKAMEERSDKIATDLDKAETARTDAETKASEYDAKLADAKTEAGRIMEEARQTADTYRDQRKGEADAEIAELKERAAADVEAAKAQAMDDLRGQVAELAIGAAEQVVGKSLDRDTNVALVEQYIDQVGSRS
jgi:F-type H+-transporting ATPase subunit b